MEEVEVRLREMEREATKEEELSVEKAIEELEKIRKAPHFSLEGPSVKINAAKCKVWASNPKEFEKVKEITVITNPTNDVIYDFKEKCIYVREKRIDAVNKQLPPSLLSSVFQSTKTTNIKEALKKFGGVIIPSPDGGAGGNYIKLESTNLGHTTFLKEIIAKALPKLQKIPSINHGEISSVGVGGFVCGFVVGVVNEILEQTLKDKHPELLKWIRRIIAGLVVALGIGVFVLMLVSGAHLVTLIVGVLVSLVYSIVGGWAGQLIAKLLFWGARKIKSAFSKEKEEEEEGEEKGNKKAAKGKKRVAKGKEPLVDEQEEIGTSSSFPPPPPSRPSSIRGIQPPSSFSSRESNPSTPSLFSFATPSSAPHVCAESETSTDGFLYVGTCACCLERPAKVGFVHDESEAHMAYCVECGTRKLGEMSEMRKDERKCICEKPFSSFFKFDESVRVCQIGTCLEVGLCSLCDETTSSVWRVKRKEEKEAIANKRPAPLEVRFCNECKGSDNGVYRYGSLKTVHQSVNG